MAKVFLKDKTMGAKSGNRQIHAETDSFDLFIPKKNKLVSPKLG